MQPKYYRTTVEQILPVFLLKLLKKSIYHAPILQYPKTESTYEARFKPEASPNPIQKAPID